MLYACGTHTTSTCSVAPRLLFARVIKYPVQLWHERYSAPSCRPLPMCTCDGQTVARAVRCEVLMGILVILNAEGWLGRRFVLETLWASVFC